MSLINPYFTLLSPSKLKENRSRLDVFDPSIVWIHDRVHGDETRIEKLKYETNLLFSKPAFDMSPISRAYLSGRKRESDANNFFGAVSKLFSLCAKYVYWNLSSFGASATLQTCRTQL